MGGFPDAVAKYLLVHLGVSVKEVDETNRVFWQKVENGTLGEFKDALLRISNAVKENEWLKGYIVSSLVTVLEVQESNFTNEQSGLLDLFQSLFDMRPSDFEDAINKGQEWGIALKYVATEYVKSREGKK